jgi:hypothetical protein
VAIAWSARHLFWGIVAALVIIVVVITEGSYRAFRVAGNAHRAELENQREAHEKQVAALVAAQPAPVVVPGPLQPHYHHHPMGDQLWITEHCVGVFNPPDQEARRVRMYLVRMEPHPRNFPPHDEPAIPYTVPLQSGGDPSAGQTIGSGQQELWIIGRTGTGSDGSMYAGAFAVPDQRGLSWQFDPDERWRLRYQIVCDGRPDVEFSIVVTAEDGHIRCDLEL